MADFEKKVKEIDHLFEKGDKKSMIRAENRANKLKMEIQRSECLEKDTRIAHIEVVLGICQTFLGKFDIATENLESALKNHAKSGVLNLCDSVKALAMFDFARHKIDVMQDAKNIIASFIQLKKSVRMLSVNE